MISGAGGEPLRVKYGSRLPPGLIRKEQYTVAHIPGADFYLFTLPLIIYIMIIYV
jgi:hypothetical protein